VRRWEVKSSGPEKADIVVRVTSADLFVDNDYICGNDLQAEGTDLKGQPFGRLAPGPPCPISEAHFDECFEKSIRGAVEYIFHSLGARTPRRE
jgi:hypothetical protein